LSLHQAGRVEEALAVFQRSLKINPDQPKVERFFKEYGLNHTVAE
jgi:hypothetical protein